MGGGGKGEDGEEEEIKKQESRTVLDAEQVICGAKPQNFQNTDATFGSHVTAPPMPNMELVYYFKCKAFLNIRLLSGLHHNR